MVRSVDVTLTTDNGFFTKDGSLDRFICPVQSVVITPFSMPVLGVGSGDSVPKPGAPEYAIVKKAEAPAVFVGPWVMATFLDDMSMKLNQAPLGVLKVGDLLRVGTHGGATPWMRLMEIRTDIPAVYNSLESELQLSGTAGVGSQFPPGGVHVCQPGTCQAVALRMSSPLDCTTLPVKSVLYRSPQLNGDWYTTMPVGDGSIQYADYSTRSQMRLTSTIDIPLPRMAEIDYSPGGGLPTMVVNADRSDASLPYPMFAKLQASGSAALRLDARTRHVLTVELISCTLESLPWVDLQYGHEYERPRALVVRIDHVTGNVISNDPHFDGAFAVIQLGSDEDARFAGTHQIHRSVVRDGWSAPVSGALNEFKVNVSDQTGAVFTGHWSMHFKLHVLD